MKRALQLLASLVIFTFPGRAQTPAGEEEPRPANQPAPPEHRFPAYAPIIETPGLPRVLLLGDSISIGYTVPVRTRLAGRANVLRPPENCSDTGRGLARLDQWLAAGSGKWDVIHFNFGLHDIKYLDPQGKYVSPDKGKQVTPLPQYEANLRALVARLKQTGARLIFATTTPVPDGASGRIEPDAVSFNAVARRVMQQTGVEVNDLFAVAAPVQSEIQRPRNVHFTPAGDERLADAVAASIARSLAPPSRGGPDASARGTRADQHRP